MGLRILFDETALRQGLYQEDQFAPEASAPGWPRDTWFQRRLRYLRDQQRKRLMETDVVFETSMGTIIVRQPTDDR